MMSRIDDLLAIDDEDIIVFDTETTGLRPEGSRADEILSLSIANAKGDILFDELVKPVGRKTWKKAEEINGITPAMVKDKKPLSDYKDELDLIFGNAKLIVAYNAEFDIGFLNAAGIKVPKKKVFDVMKEFAKIHGEYNAMHRDYSWCKLEDCACFYGLSDFDKHQSLGDVSATLYCYKSLISDPLFGERRYKPKAMIDEFGDFAGYDYDREVVSSGYAESKQNDSSMDCQTDCPSTYVQIDDSYQSLDDADAGSAKSGKSIPKIATGAIIAFLGIFIAICITGLIGYPILLSGLLIAFKGLK